MWLSGTRNNVGTEQEIILCVSPHPVLNCINFCSTAKVLLLTPGKMFFLVCFLLFRLTVWKVKWKVWKDRRGGGTGVISELITLNRRALLTKCFRCSNPKFLNLCVFWLMPDTNKEFILQLTNWGCCDSEQRVPGRKHFSCECYQLCFLTTILR